MRGFLRVAVINVLILAVAILLVELFFGAWVRDDSLNRLNLVRDRKLQFSTSHLYPSETGVAVYTRDRFALRGSGFEDPSQISLLTVGGSTTDQRYVSDELTWQSVLERDLRSVGKAIAIGNAGVDGQSTAGHLKNFDWWFPRVPGLQPRYILFYVGINDFYRQTELDYDDLRTEGERLTARQLLREYSAIYHFAYTLYGMYQAEVRHRAGHNRIDFESIAWTDSPMRDDHEQLMRAPLEAYRSRLQALAARTRAMGATPIFVTQPTHWYRVKYGVQQGAAEASDFAGVKINGVDRHRMMRLLDRVTCDVAASTGPDCIDLGAIEAWEDSDFYDFSHMTPAGAEKVGHELAKAVAPLL